MGKMKVEVITLHNIYNYGSVLQTYATQIALEKFGCNVEFIDYYRKDLINYKTVMQDALERSGIWNRNALFRCIYKCIKTPSYKKKNLVFNEFLKRYIHLTERKYYSVEDIKKNFPDADLYCTGSDQMWNTNYNKGIERAYYLDFTEKYKFSYATSIGMDELDYKQETKELLTQYAHISVREISAVKLLSENGIRNVRCVLDPTLALDKEIWEKISAPRIIKEPYLLIYQLNPNKRFDEYACWLAKEKNIKVVRLNLMYDNIFLCGKPYVIPKVEEFLSLIANAEYVVTDSFHGTVFSINFEKQFCVIKPPKFGTRIDSILALLDLSEQIIPVNSAKGQKVHRIDYLRVTKKLNKLRDENWEYLNLVFNDYYAQCQGGNR